MCEGGSVREREGAGVCMCKCVCVWEILVHKLEKNNLTRNRQRIETTQIKLKASHK